MKVTGTMATEMLTVATAVAGEVPGEVGLAFAIGSL